MLRGDFHIFVSLDVFECFFKAEHDGRNDFCFFVGAGSAHVGELFTLRNVHHQIFILAVLAHHLPGIHFFLREDEEFATVLELVDGIGVSSAAFHGYDGAIGAAHDVAFPRLVVEKTVCHNGFAGTCRKHIGAQTDDAARRNFKFQVDAVVLRFHHRHFAFTAGHHINHLAGVFFRHIDGEAFDGLALHAINHLNNHLRLTHLQFVAFASHFFNQHAQV